MKSPGMATEQQTVFMIVSTDKENEYPKYIKLSIIPVDNKNFIHKFFRMRAKISSERVLNTDGKTTFSDLSKELILKSEKIVYSEAEHRLKWLNIIVGNIKNNIVGIYHHGVTKSSLSLFLHEQEWRFNHRYTGTHIMEKISKYIKKSFPIESFPIDLEKLSKILELSGSYFSPCA